MSAFIGSIKGPNHNSPHDVADVWCSRGGVEVRLLFPRLNADTHVVPLNFDPIAARNLAALLVRASEEVERIRSKPEGA